MQRRLWSLLILLLLALATQVTADDGDDDRDGDRKDKGNKGDKEDKGAGKEDDEKRKAKGAAERRQGEGGRDDEAGDQTPSAPPAGPAPAPPAGRPGVIQPLPADAGVAILQTVLPGRVTFTFLVSAAGPLDQAQLAATLPGAAAWTVTGPGVSACGLTGAELACNFRGLSAGDVQLVQATAPLRQAPAWELVAHATVTASGDSFAGNDSATAVVGILLA